MVEIGERSRVAVPYPWLPLSKHESQLVCSRFSQDRHPAKTEDGQRVALWGFFLGRRGFLRLVEWGAEGRDVLVVLDAYRRRREDVFW